MAGQGNGKMRQVSPAVYRRRRLFVGIGVLIVLIILIAIIVAVLKGNGNASAGASQPVATSSNSVTATATEPQPSATAPTTPSCDPSKIQVLASTDAPSYSTDVNPVLTLTVTNGGTVACDVNVGTSQMEFLVQSGTDRIFSSKDCQSGTTDLIKSIPPGGSETANFPWQRNRTTVGCTAVATTPAAGTYTLTVSLGALTSPNTVFELLP